MSPIRRFDHVGITVADLDKVTAFFVGLPSRSRVGHS
jgi:catechol 2,3-dioxygenase-like lactoylglutathione lyase family enzyme